MQTPGSEAPPVESPATTAPTATAPPPASDAANAASEPAVDVSEAPTAPHPRVAVDAPAPAVVVAPRPPVASPRELAAMLAIIALADLGLYQSTGGAGRAVMLAGVPIVMAAAATQRRGSRRLAAIAALLGLVALRCGWQASVGATLLGVGLLLPFAIALRTPRSFVPELASSMLGSAAGAARQLRSFFAGVGMLAGPLRPSRSRSAAVVVPALLVLVFGAIFTAANPAIQAWLANASALFDGAPAPMRVVFWATSAFAAAALLRPLIRSIAALDTRLGSSEHALITEAQATTAHLALARNGMIALNALFLGYNALDAVYLWAGRAPTGVTFTEYAHAGAAWLTVAFILSTIVLGAMFRGAIEHDPRGRLARGLAYLWAGQNFVLAAGTFRRITMYISYSGLTQLRIVGMFGTALTILGLAIVVAKIVRRRTMLWVLRRQLDAFALAVALFIVAPTDELAMRYNVARITADQYRPLLHLYEQPLRAEAVPGLLPLLDHPDPDVRAGVAVLLADVRDRLRADDEAATWLDAELARGRALAALDAAAPALAHALPIDRDAAAAQLRGIAYGINAEVERVGDDAPFDWRVRHYAPRD